MSSYRGQAQDRDRRETAHRRTVGSDRWSRLDALRGLTNPVMVVALLVLLINDHVLKIYWPSWITGKLSDFAGLTLFPVVLAGCVSLVAPRLLHGRDAIFWSAVVTGLTFSTAQLSEFGSRAYRYAWGSMQYPLRLLFDSEPVLGPVQHTPDPTDLLALTALIIPWLVSRPPRGGRALRQRAAGGSMTTDDSQRTTRAQPSQG